MDRSLDAIIAERPDQNRNRRPQGQGRRRDGMKKSYRGDRVDLDLNSDWVHDKYEDDREARPSRAPRRSRVDRYSSSPGPAPTKTRIRVENLHYDITENELEDLFSQIGPVTTLSLVYDRAGRSEGVAFVTYDRLNDARTAINEFDGANAKGQPIRLTIVPAASGRRERNPFDNVERAKGSLFDRVERPRDRSLSPGSDSEPRRRGGGGGGRRGQPSRRSDVSKPPPAHIDRYVPGQTQSQNQGASSPVRRGRNGVGGRRRQMVNGRPRVTQDELDQEMDDYWGGGSGNPNPGVGVGVGTVDNEPVSNDTQQQVAPASSAAVGDDDVDMIE